MEIVVSILLGYLMGCVNPSYLIGKKKGFDIRETGSGNAGASNAVITFGKFYGVFCALFDIVKPCAAILLSRRLFPEFPYAFAVTGVAAVIGHVFPVFMGFRGGKGLACLGGLILFFDIRVFALMLVSEIVLVLVTDYIFTVALSASVVFPIVFYLISGDALSALILCIVPAVMVFKHRDNIARLKNGTEIRFSFLWNHDEELERVKNNTEREKAL